MTKRHVTVSPANLAALFLMAAGLIMLVCGAASLTRRANPLPLSGAALSSLRPGRFVSGSAETLLSVEGAGLGEGKLFPLAAVNAVTGETCYIIAMGSGEYITLAADAAEARAIEKLYGEGRPIPVFGVVRRGLPLEPNYTALSTALGTDASDAPFSREYHIELAENEPSPWLSMGAFALLLGTAWLTVRRKDILISRA